MASTQTSGRRARAPRATATGAPPSPSSVKPHSLSAASWSCCRIRFSAAWRCTNRTRRLDAPAKAPGKRRVQFLRAADADAMKHRFGHLRRTKQPRDIDHQLRIRHQAFHVLPRIPGPVLQVVQYSCRIQAHALPFIEPARAAIALEWVDGWIAFDLQPERVEPVVLANRLDARERHLLTRIGQKRMAPFR